MLFAGWEVRIVKKCDRGPENTFIFLNLTKFSERTKMI